MSRLQAGCLSGECSAASATFDKLEKMILDGRATPGTRLVVRPLAEKLGLSPTPIKTALAALERAGLVVSTFQSGYSVPWPNRERFIEASQMLCEFDTMSVFIVMKAEDATERIRGIIDYEDTHLVEMGFHQQLWRASRQSQLIEMATLMRGRALVSSGQLLRDPQVVKGTLQEHARVVEALRDHDAKTAVRALKKHSKRTIATVLALMDERFANKKAS